MGHRERQLAAVLSSHRASRHVSAPSLGQYASLSFVVIGRGQREIQLAADYESNESIFYTFFLSIYVRHRIVCIYIFLNGYCK
jgi:hypothetical protein